jgi:hypothetical protein
VAGAARGRLGRGRRGRRRRLRARLVAGCRLAASPAGGTPCARLRLATDQRRAGRGGARARRLGGSAAAARRGGSCGCLVVRPVLVLVHRAPALGLLQLERDGRVPHSQLLPALLQACFTVTELLLPRLNGLRRWSARVSDVLWQCQRGQNVEASTHVIAWAHGNGRWSSHDLPADPRAALASPA